MTGFNNGIGILWASFLGFLHQQSEDWHNSKFEQKIH